VSAILTRPAQSTVPRDPGAREALRLLQTLLDQYARVLVAPKVAAHLLSITPRQLARLTMPRGPIPCLRVPGRPRKAGEGEPTARAIRYLLTDLQKWAEELRDRQCNGRGALPGTLPEP
jgi:hypothetical protein